MKRFLYMNAWLIGMGSWLLGWACVVGAAEPLPADFMPSDQVRPGMVGEGRTVFHGFKVESFHVEILGVQHNAMPGSNMILAKLKGPLLEQHGVVAGMSGSPVFINGKLIGAVSYGWSFAYAPYCGITPIEQMWTVFEAIGKRSAVVGASVAQAGGAPGGGVAAWDWQPEWKAIEAAVMGQAPEGQAPASFRPTLPAFSGIKGEMRPLMTPLYLSGASPATERLLRGFLSSRGIEMMGAGSMAGSGGGATDEPAPPIENGSSLGVPILSGDLSLSGVGTVTYRQGDRLIAFGHPMFFVGETAAPMAPAYVFGFMQSYERSFKLSDVREVIGTIDQDRLFAIGGKIGAAPPRLPISVQITGAAASRPRPYEFSCWKDRNFLPTMAATAAQEAYTASVAEGGELTARMDYQIKLTNGRTIDKHFYSSARAEVIDRPIMSLLLDMFLLIDNPYRQADVQAIKVKIDVQPGVHQTSLVTAQADHDQYLAGDTVQVTGRFRPWRGEEYDRRFEVKLPRDLRPGAYVIHLVDSQGALRIERANHPERFQPRDFDGVVQLAQEVNIADDEFRLYLLDPAVDVNVNGYTMGQLPGTVETLIQNTAAPQMQQQSVGRMLERQMLRMDGTFNGSQSLLIQVVDHFDE